MKHKQGETMLTKTDVMQVLNVSLSTVNRLMKSKELPFQKIRGAVRFKRQDVDEYLERSRKA